MLFLFTLILIAGCVYIGIQYNKTQALAQNVMEAHSNTMVSMKKRADLVNKLIDITKGYGDHEKLMHISISQNESASLSRANAQMDGALYHLNTMARNFPEIKANHTYQQLMKDLHKIEDNLQYKRESYNQSVKSYNSSITSIPFVFLASTLGFKVVGYFNVDNSDALENIKDFSANDGEALKGLFKNIGTQTKTIAEITIREGKSLLVNSTKEKAFKAPASGSGAAPATPGKPETGNEL